MHREQSIQQIAAAAPWDILIIGGGATGLGCGVEAASRGYRAAVLEQRDFAKGTSSRSTKLVHGGVRYLRQGNVALVREGLRERGLLLRNAPHLARPRAFVIPAYQWWERSFYGAGLKMYDALAGALGLGKSEVLSAAETLERLPNARAKGLRGGVLYYDGQFDDARLAIHLAMTMADLGGVPVNYMGVTGLLKEGGKVAGVRAVDGETGAEHAVRAKAVVNATGVFVDEVLRLDNPRAGRLVTPSQGIHLMLEAAHWPGEFALMAPRTSDGRVLFAVPWHGKVVLGTTDTKVDAPSLEPAPLEEEIEFVLRNAAQYLARPPRRAEVRSIFAGLRPLMRSTRANTAAITRDHYLTVSSSGLVTITGGKWTTYRRMAEETIDLAAQTGGLPGRPSRTSGLAIHGAAQVQPHAPLTVYGSDAAAIEQLMAGSPEMAAFIHPRLPYRKAEIIWAIRHEMARTVEDLLARRTRALLLDARASLEAAPGVAEWLRAELGQTAAWKRQQEEEYGSLAQRYLLRD